MLEDGQRRLLSLVRALGFGTIDDLHVRGGLPVWDPPPTARREIKFGPESEKHELLRTGTVTQHDRELFGTLEQLGDGVVERIEVRHGLPFRLVYKFQEGRP